MYKTNLALKTTNWCNLKCRHCCECSGPRVAPDLMPIATAEKYIRQFCEMNIPKWETLTFTGGETMVPYYHGTQVSVPDYIDIACKYNMIPVFKTNGMWGHNAELRTQILDDLTKKAYQYETLMTLDISIDEFHNNLQETANIIQHVVSDNKIIVAVRICIVGLNTLQSKQKFLQLVSILAEHDILCKTTNTKALAISRKNRNLYALMPYDFEANIASSGRAQKNGIGEYVSSGMPDRRDGNCLQIDNYDIATLNYKWCEPVDGQDLQTVFNNLYTQMKKGLYCR